MSEVPYSHQANDSAHSGKQVSIQSTPSGKLNAEEASAATADTESSPKTRKSKASTFSVLSFNSTRRMALSPNTFSPNIASYRHTSSGASPATAQLSEGSLVRPARRASGQSSIGHKENQKVSPELKKQLESLISPASRASSQSSPLSATSKGVWSIGTSSIAIRPSEPVPSIVTTELWEPPTDAPEAPPEDSDSDRIPTPISMSGYQSEYVSFPPFESYPRNSRPGLRSRCSDKSWHLLQKLKGKIVEMHNAGLQSSRSSSRNSISSRKSRSPGRPFRENKQPRTRPTSESGGSRTRLDAEPSIHPRNKAATISGGTLRASKSKRASITEINSAALGKESANNIETSAHQATIVAVTPKKGLGRSHQTLEAIKEPPGLPAFTRPLELASSLFQSLVTIASGDTPKSTPASPNHASDAKSKSPPRITAQASPSLTKNQVSPPVHEDSSGDEMTFMEYIRKFSDSSPKGAQRRALFSTSSRDTSTIETRPELSTTVDQAVPRTVTFEDPSYDEVIERRATTAISPIPEVHSNDEIPPTISHDCGTGKALIKYTTEDYETITTYFYNTQARVLKKKWPFLYDNEIKYLIDEKWLEMEWEDLEDWAQESAKHIDEEGYVEPDLFEDLTLVDPRGLEVN